MLEFPRDSASVRWDAWKAFHVGINKWGLTATGSHIPPPIIMFETGEVVLCSNVVNKDYRGVYKDLGLEVWTSTDPRLPKLYWNDKPVPKAWYDNYGHQPIVVSRALGYATGLRLSGTGDLTRPIPGWLKNASKVSGYLPDLHSLPIGRPIHLHQPFTIYTKEEREHIKEMKRQCCVAARLLDTRYSGPAIKPERMLEVNSPADMTEVELGRVLSSGVARPTTEVDYLEVRDEPEA